MVWCPYELRGYNVRGVLEDKKFIERPTNDSDDMENVGTECVRLSSCNDFYIWLGNNTSPGGPQSVYLNPFSVHSLFLFV